MFVVGNFSLFQPVREKNLKEWIQFSYNNVIDRLCVETSQSINDLGEQMLRLDTSQLALIRVASYTKRTDLLHITPRLEENNVRVLELNFSHKFALMKHVVLNVKSTQITMSSSISNINKCF